MERIDINKIKPNPDNPRFIRDDNYAKLVQSIKDFPEMLELRPVVVNKDMIVLGGNMRLKACKEAGLKEIPYILAENLTPEQQKEFIVKDNIGFGEWDWMALTEHFNTDKLIDWGMEELAFPDNIDYSGKNQEINVDEFSDKMIINLKYSEEDYVLVKEQLSKISSTPEMAVLKLLGNE